MRTIDVLEQVHKITIQVNSWHVEFIYKCKCIPDFCTASSMGQAGFHSNIPIAFVKAMGFKDFSRISAHNADNKNQATSTVWIHLIESDWLAVNRMTCKVHKTHLKTNNKKANGCNVDFCTLLSIESHFLQS